MKQRFSGTWGSTLMFLPSKILEGAIGIVTLSYLTHALTKSAYDDFATVNTVVVFAYLLLMGWLGNSTNRYVGDERENSAFYTTGTALWLVINVIAYAAAAVVFFATGTTLWFWACAMLTATSIYQICLNMLVQTGKRLASVVLSLLSAVTKPAVIFITCRLMTQSGATDSILPAVLGYMLSELLTGLVAVIILKLPHFVRINGFSSPMMKKFFAYGFPLLGVSLSVGLLNFVDRFILILFDADFGIYSANNSIATSVFNMIMVGIMRAVYPPALESYRKSGFDGAKPVVSTGARLYLLVALPAAAGLAGVSKALSNVLFADGYQVGASVIGLTAFAMFFTGLTEYAIKGWEMGGDTKPIMQNALMALALKVVLSIVFLPILGFSGAALGSMIAFGFYFIISALRVRRIMLFKIPAVRIFRIVTAAAVCGISAALVTYFVQSQILGLILAIAVGFALYLAILLFSGEINEEVGLIRRKLDK